MQLAKIILLFFTLSKWNFRNFAGNNSEIFEVPDVKIVIGSWAFLDYFCYILTGGC